MDSIKIACAPNLSGIIEEIINSFSDKDTSFKIAIGDNCNVYYKEILSGQKFDIFLSADAQNIDNLTNLNFVKKSAIYAKGKLCLWSQNEFDITNLVNLKISLPNPSVAPYGKAAFEYLYNIHLLDTVKPNLVFGNSPFEVSRFVLENKADVAFLPLSFVRSALKSNSFKILQSGYKPIIQKGALLINTGKKAESFFNFLIESAKSKQILEYYGF